jgi:hypothetical protein
MRFFALFLLVFSVACSTNRPQSETGSHDDFIRGLENYETSKQTSYHYKNEEIYARIILDNKEKLKRCYDIEKSKGTTGISGMIILNFTIDYQGRILRAGVEESDLPISLKACLIKTLWAISFPPPNNRGQITVRQPLKF